MKYILPLLILLFYVPSAAQDPELSDKIWYLQKLVIDSNEFPSSSETGHPELGFFQDGDTQLYIYHPQCEDIAWYGIECFGLDTINVLGYWGGLPGGCSSWPQIDYYQKHHSFYNPDHANPLFYTLTSVGEQWSLIITNAQGNEAHYGTAQLNANDLRVSPITLYPNPAKDIVFIPDLRELDFKELRIYDASGRFIPTDKIIDWSNESLDISKLVNGLYFIHARCNDGRILSQKFVKI